VFAEGDGHAFVRRQPDTAGDRRSALHALVSCPTGSIGSQGGDRPASVMDDFPLLIEEPVFYCGFNSPKSYGGNGYLVRRPEGNWLIDSPKFQPRLVRRLEQMGGVSTIFLTHSDDVADARLYAERFGARRVIHRAELHSQPDAEVVLDGEEPVELAPGFLAIPTPGHTAGHCVLLFGQRFLFTGDHLAWDRHGGRFDAHRDYCWFSWERQVESMARLARFTFEWVLPGHGQRVRQERDEMRRQMQDLVRRMRDASEP
jgi:glyoxylase-like metal-dependent hydrolase (beta-lactamase superfamily II)